MNHKWEFYKDTNIQWRWRCTDPDGNIVGESAEGYANKPACVGNARGHGWQEARVELSTNAIENGYQ
jgi:uncharacterized protein YegP (UPF0339 family)